MSINQDAEELERGKHGQNNCMLKLFHFKEPQWNQLKHISETKNTMEEEIQN